MKNWLTVASRWGIVLTMGLGVSVSAGCSAKKNQLMENGPGVSGTSGIGGRRVMNLFGLRDAERHLIEVGTLHGQLFLMHQDPETGEFEWVDCPLETPYEYVQHPKRTHEMEIRSTAQLAAELPLSQTQFQAAIEHGSWFKFSWAAVGSYTPGKFQLPRTNAECTRATHFVQLLTVGAVTWSEMSDTTVEAAVDAKVAKIGGKASSGEKTADVLGNLEACFAAEGSTSGADCKIPLQVSVAALRAHHWCPAGNKACEAATSMTASTCLEPGPGCLPKPDAPKPSETEIVPIYRGTATASRYVSESMERAFLLRNSAPLRGYGYADQGALLYSGLVKSGGILEANIEVEEGSEYVLVAAGDSDAQDLDLSVSGAAEASETSGGRDSELKFRAKENGIANFVLKGARISSKEGSFVAVLVLKKGGANIAAELIRGTIRKVFERGELVSEKLEATRFHEGQWAFYVLGMHKGVFRQSGLELPVGTTYAFAAADENATDIDLALISGDELKQVDTDDDALPIVAAELGSTLTAELVVASEGEPLTVVGVALLQKTAVSAKEACDSADYSGLTVGTRVVLGRHTAHLGDDNWADGMAEYVGRVGTITERAGQDKSGCEVVRVDVDSGNYGWRLRDTKVDDNSIPSEGVLSYGRWQLAKRGENLLVWRADQKLAGEFWNGSNGWWNWLSGGKTFTVWSAGSKDSDPDNFKVKPWLTSGQAVKKGAPAHFTSGNQKVQLVADSVVVTTADGGIVTFKADGSVHFRTYDGKDVKM